jgi:hypothetical protein
MFVNVVLEEVFYEEKANLCILSSLHAPLHTHTDKKKDHHPFHDNTLEII